jgi:hypothetical protein
MESVHETLLMRVRRHGDQQAWTEFIGIYRPVLTRYARARGLNEAESECIVATCQTAIRSSIAESEFRIAGDAFKQWLARQAAIIVERIQSGDDSSSSALDANPPVCERSAILDEDFERIWNEEHLRHGLDQLRTEIDFRTFEAFHRIVIDGWSIERVSEHYELTPEYVHAMRSRLTCRLRLLKRSVLGE